MNNLLEFQDFSFSYITRKGTARILSDINLSIEEMGCVGLVGESGSGKSTLARSILRINDFKHTVKYEGHVYFEGSDLLAYSEPQMDRIRGNEISIVFQDPLSYLNPTYTVKTQIREVLHQHGLLPENEIDNTIAQALRDVCFESPERIMSSYPFELSGGMRQRVVIAMAIITRPKLLIVDEVTSSLDALVESEVLSILQDLRSKYKTAILMISHDIHTVSRFTGKIAVMYAGQILEVLPSGDLQQKSQHPYTQALIACVLAERKNGCFPFIRHDIAEKAVFSLEYGTLSTNNSVLGEKDTTPSQ